MSDVLLRVEGLRTVLDTADGEVRAVDGVDFELHRGRTFAILGESGCGKSMTAFSLMGLLPPGGRVAAGRALLDGVDLLRLPEKAMRRVRGGRIGMIFQEPQTALNPVMRVGDQIGEGLARHRGLRGRALRAEARQLLVQVGIPDPDGRLDAYPHQLSGGMKQRVIIAMALAGRPDILIADEPTTALDVTIQAQVLALLRRLQEELGMTILLITHDLGVVAEMAHEVGVMYAGELVETGERDAFFAHPRHPYARRLFAALPGAAKKGGRLVSIPGMVPPLTRRFTGCRFTERCDRAFAPCAGEIPAWTPVDECQAVRCHLYTAEPPAEAERSAEPSPPPPAGGAPGAKRPLLEVRDLRVHFPVRSGLLRRATGAIRAVDGIDLSIPEGHTVALVGESGCGKTTAGKALLQLIRPSGGSVLFDGIELTALGGGALRPYRRALQIIFQDPYSSMNPRMRVDRIVEEGMRSQGLGGGSGERQARVDRLLEQVGMDSGVKHRYPHEFSGGQRQRICIARALAVSPRLVVCDEPTSALDVSVQAQILNLLRALQDDLRLAYLFITHNMSVVEYLAHEVAVMYLGRIVEFGPTDRVMAAPAHPYTRALLSAVPVPDPRARREVIRLAGDPPSPHSPPAGCHFHPRCPEAMDVCRTVFPETVERGQGHRVACHLYPGTGDTPARDLG
ncbi:MAG: ABC transporter ATP-binding protein [Gammaproteobacteria bacterium]|nr:ABC transporter ATP-binding protein [Gammaproteobacteria bacterium]